MPGPDELPVLKTTTLIPNSDFTTPTDALPRVVHPTLIPNEDFGVQEISQVTSTPDATTPVAGGDPMLGQWFLHSTAGPWVLGGLVLGLSLLIFLEHHSNASQSTLPPTMTAAQAAQAQQVMSKQLAAADKTLAQAGYSAEHIAQAHNEIAIADGTQIALSVPKAASDFALPTKVIVSGNMPPSRYTAMDAVDSKKYIATLSAAPSLSDLTKNTAVIHGLQANAQ